MTGKDVGIKEELYICKSLIWIYTTQTSNKGALEVDINTANRWSNTKITGGIWETTKILGNYSHIQMLLPILTRYSQAIEYPVS